MPFIMLRKVDAMMMLVPQTTPVFCSYVSFWSTADVRVQLTVMVPRARTSTGNNSVPTQVMVATPDAKKPM